MKGGKSSCLMFSRGDASWGISLLCNEWSQSKGIFVEIRLDQCYLCKLNIGSDNTRIILTLSLSLSFELDEGFE